MIGTALERAHSSDNIIKEEGGGFRRHPLAGAHTAIAPTVEKLGLLHQRSKSHEDAELSKNTNTAGDD